MTGYSADVAASRAGADRAEIDRLTQLGVLSGAADGGYTDADIRRVQVVQELERSGLLTEALANLLRDGGISLEFIDEAGFGVFAPLSDVTFAELSERTGIPVDLLTVLRDVTGGKSAAPGDRVREDELEILPLMEYQLELDFDRRQSSGRCAFTATACGGLRRARPSGGVRRSRTPCLRREDRRTTSASGLGRSRRVCRRRPMGRGRDLPRAADARLVGEHRWRLRAGA